MAVQLVSVLVEIVRPYLGYYGNLAEKVWLDINSIISLNI
jgi:hypothetical protein